MLHKFGLIGTGAMAGAILNRLLQNLGSLGLKAEEIIAYDIDPTRLNSFSECGITAAGSVGEVLEKAETVMLGIKPQVYAEILSEVKNINSANIISIMAGVKIESLRKYFPGPTGIIRAMPNMPAKAGKGMTALCFDGVGETSRGFILSLFDSCGKTVVISEDKFDAVTSISGSGPAYVYLFASALIKGGIEGGLTYEESRILALQTIEGAATLAAMENDTDLNEMVNRVCSKGGTTIEAVEVFKAKNLEGIVSEAVKACRDKSILMTEKLK